MTSVPHVSQSRLSGVADVETHAPLGLRRDRAVMAIARRQHAVIRSDQLAALGVGRGAIAHRIAQGWFRRMHRGVYLVGPTELALSASMAAVLACGADAFLSHLSAAALWGLTRPGDGDVDVTVVARTIRVRPGIRVHRARWLRSDERARHQGIPVTSPARTLLDLATVVCGRELARAAEEAQVQRLLTPAQVQAYLARRSHRHGALTLRAATRQDPAFTRSEAERRFLELLRSAALPEPQANVRVHGHEVDFLWRRQELVVEVDGYAYHSSRAAFERDRRRDAELEAAGIHVRRITWRQIAEEPEALVARLAVALAAVPTGRAA